MFRLALSIALTLSTGIATQAQPKDPGVRGGAPGAGQPIAGLTPGELGYFTNHGAPEFNTVETVADGLGPRFNLDSCGGFHVHPAVGGSSPPTNNPQVVRASLMVPAMWPSSHCKHACPSIETSLTEAPTTLTLKAAWT
jgi:hypothetical protein